MMHGKAQRAFSSSVLSLDGTQHCENRDSFTLETGLPMTSAKNSEEAACGETVQEFDSSSLLLNRTSNFGRCDSSDLKIRTSDDGE